jgi:hypothetical protein
MKQIPQILIAHFTLSFLIVGLILAATSLWRRPRPLTAASVINDIFDHYILFVIGWSFFFNFLAQVIIGEAMAKRAGWEPSPFQAELGFASLGFAAVGFLTYRRSLTARAAAVVGPAVFMLSAALGRICRTGAEAFENRGDLTAPLLVELVFPIIGLALLGLQYRFSRKSALAGKSLCEFLRNAPFRTKAIESL